MGGMWVSVGVGVWACLAGMEWGQEAFVEENLMFSFQKSVSHFIIRVKKKKNQSDLINFTKSNIE